MRPGSRHVHLACLHDICLYASVTFPGQRSCSDSERFMLLTQAQKAQPHDIRALSMESEPHSVKQNIDHEIRFLTAMHAPALSCVCREGCQAASERAL